MTGLALAGYAVVLAWIVLDAGSWRHARGPLGTFMLGCGLGVLGYVIILHGVRYGWV